MYKVLFKDMKPQSTVQQTKILGMIIVKQEWETGKIQTAF